MYCVDRIFLKPLLEELRISGNPGTPVLEMVTYGVYLVTFFAFAVQAVRSVSPDLKKKKSNKKSNVKAGSQAKINVSVPNS